MTLTKSEKDRLSQIRKNVKKFKRLGHDVKTWEATFFLKIIDRLVGERK